MKSLFVPAPLLAAFRSSASEHGLWATPGLLTGILSPQDVAFYIHANAQSTALVGSDFNDSFPNLLQQLAAGPEVIWPGSTSDSNTREIQRAWSALAQNPAKAAKLIKPTDDMVPSVLYIDDQLVIYTLLPRGQETDGWYEFIAKIHPFFNFSALAALPIFGQYLKHRTSVNA